MSRSINSDVGLRVRRMLDMAAIRAQPQYSLELCEELEGQIPIVLRSEVFSSIRETKPENEGMTVGPRGTLFLNGIPFQLRIALSPHDCTNLEMLLVGIMPPVPTLLPPVEITIESGIGRIKKVTLYASSRFEDQIYLFGDVIRAVIGACYRWLGVFSSEQLLAFHQGPSESYEHLRKVLPEHLCKTIRFNGIVENQGLYVIDPFVYQDALASASKSSLLLTRSPLEACADFFTTHVGLDKMFSEAVLREDKTIPVDLMQARYANQGVNLSETIVFGTNEIAVQPLVKSDPFSLVAGYPEYLRNEIEPELLRNRCEFTKIVRRHSSELSQRPASRPQPCANRNHISESIAEFLGVLSAAALSHLVKHPS